ncbi:MAG: patatin-like phospholipase family protein [Acidobacteriaceae bacterium]|nr:patatin-like phospholipase family protein [Acidobacteriaceae bacterium]
MKNRRDVLKYVPALPALADSLLSAQEASPWKPPVGSGKNYLILACDGGGMRGYLSSLLLQKLNQDLQIFGTNNQKIDLYAGTSTGGLIALGLGQGKTIDSVVDLYKGSGAKIFSPLAIQPRCILSAADRAQAGTTEDITALWQVLFDDIGEPSLRTVLEGFIPGNPLLSSFANKVMVATFQLGLSNPSSPNWSPLVIDNFEGSAGANTHLYDAALSTSAAPIYFPPYLHPQFGWCSDGGLFANNPATLAVGRAIEAGVPLSEIVVLSIGTGATPAALPVTKKNRLCFGLSYWADFEPAAPTPPFPLLNAILDGVSASADALCGQLLGAGSANSRYMRVNPALPKSVALDDYSPATLQMFEDTATAYYKTPEWTALEQWIRSTFQN